MNQTRTSVPRTVSKIPTHFVRSVLGRLLPPAAAIARMPRGELIELDKVRAEMAQAVETDPVRFFQPASPRQRAVLECDDATVRVLAVFAGNKFGKSTIGAIRSLEWAAGRPLWGRDTRSASYVPRFPTPNRGAVFAEDFDSHKETTIPTLLSWAPRGLVKKITRNPVGHIVEMTLENGSIIHFRTYDQGSDKAEGKDWHWTWCDEPPPRDVFTAVYRGLVAMNGQMLITATLLKEPWLWDEAEKDSFRVFEGDIDDNTWLNDQAKADFLGVLTDEELQVRKSGKPSQLTGLIYKPFRDDAPYVLDASDLPDPRECPSILGIDPHERRPTYAMWFYLTPDSEIIAYDYDFLVGSVADIRQQLLSREAFHVHKPRICIMDPNRGRARQIDGQSWEAVYEDFGYDVILGDDNIHLGHAQVLDYLKSGRLLFSSQLRGRGGPIFQLLRYSWDDWAKRSRMEKEVKEKPKDRNKDFPDIIRYVSMFEPDYGTLWNGPVVLDRWPARSAERGTIRAYA